MESQDRLISSFSEINLQEYRMPIICIFSSPKDYQGMFVARVFDVDQPTDYILMRTNLEAIRKEIPNGFSLVPRSETDDPRVVETWI
ncbi:hypothetical protein [Bacillus sp. J33]|uniref:hypothetical protein n=1 Tax=Bacillus sp. J33 TaxID=935836 RepID=UPI00047A75BB|nr:hypothetical protein [Bacillus sp. J33]